MPVLPRHRAVHLIDLGGYGRVMISEWSARPATTSAEDLRFLHEMLVEAFAWRPGSPRLTVSEAMAMPHVAKYVAGWGRAGDTGTLADANGMRLGACWYRLFTETDHSYGFVEARIPELTLAVRDDARGRGIGSALLASVAARARQEGHGSLSLSVEDDNPARRLYARAGFVPVARVENASTMRLDL